MILSPPDPTGPRGWGTSSTTWEVPIRTFSSPWRRTHSLPGHRYLQDTWCLSKPKAYRNLTHTTSISFLVLITTHRTNMPYFQQWCSGQDFSAGVPEGHLSGDSQGSRSYREGCTAQWHGSSNRFFFFTFGQCSTALEGCSPGTTSSRMASRRTKSIVSFGRSKEDLDLRIYSIACEWGQVYNGQAGFSIDTRLKEHHQYIQLEHPGKSAVVEHTTSSSTASASSPPDSDKSSGRGLRLSSSQ
jgi:hypothetical protein